MNVGEDVLVFYSDPQSFATFVEMMQSERERTDEAGHLLYHINLVQLLACCTEGKNVYTEIKCHSLLPLDDIVRMVKHEDCLPEVSSTFPKVWCTGVWKGFIGPRILQIENVLFLFLSLFASSNTITLLTELHHKVIVHISVFHQKSLYLCLTMLRC